jgi:hypothetical protein
MRWGWAIVAVAAGVWIWRQVGFIRMETPDASDRRERLKDIFTPTEPRRTQEANRWQLRIRNPRVSRRRHSA